MSTSKLDTSGVFRPVTVQTSSTKLSLPTQAVCIRKNGIDFLSSTRLALWTEVTVDLQTPDAKKLRGRGVVVACDGNRHSGYSVSLMFMNLSRQAQESLSLLAHS